MGGHQEGDYEGCCTNAAAKGAATSMQSWFGYTKGAARSVQGWFGYTKATTCRVCAHWATSWWFLTKAAAR